MKGLYVSPAMKHADRTNIAKRIGGLTILRIASTPADRSAGFAPICPNDWAARCRQSLASQENAGVAPMTDTNNRIQTRRSTKAATGQISLVLPECPTIACRNAKACVSVSALKKTQAERMTART